LQKITSGVDVVVSVLQKTVSEFIWAVSVIDAVVSVLQNIFNKNISALKKRRGFVEMEN